MRNKLNQRISRLEKKLNIHDNLPPDLIVTFYGDNPVDHWTITGGKLEPAIFKRIDNETDELLWGRCQTYMEANRKRGMNYMALASSSAD